MALRILHLEDSPNDAELALATLAADGIACEATRVETRADFLAALEQGGFDLILGDNSLPTFDGLTALASARAKRPESPFIFLSATLGEEAAIASLKGGAADYVLKDRPARLGPAVRNALEQKRVRDERKRAEAALRDSEERYRVIAESASDVIVAIDEDSRIMFVNPASKNVFGYAGDELIGQSLTLLIPEDRRSSHVSGLKRYVETGRRTVNWKSVEMRARHKSGKELPVEISFGEFLRDGKRFFSGIIRDISARKQAEARIARLAQLKDALSGVNQAIVHAENEEALFDEICSVMVTRAGFDCAGIGLADPQSGEMRWVAGAGAGAATLAQAYATARAGQPETYKLALTAVRERRHVVSQDFLADPAMAPWHEIGRTLGIGSAAGFPILRAGAAVGVIHVCSHARQALDDEVVALLDEAAQDVSFALDNLERERARRKAEASTTELLSIVNRSPAVFIKWNTGAKRSVELVSDNVVAFGYSPEEFISGKLNYTDAVHPEDRARFIEERKRSERESQPMVVREYRVLSRDGLVRWIEDRTWPQRDSDDRITHYQSLIQDITERKAAEQKIEYEARRYKTLLDTAIDGIHIVDRNGRLVESNSAFLRMLGYEKDEAAGLHITDWDAQLKAEVIAAKIASLRLGSEIIETKHRRKDGLVRDVEVSISGLELAGESYFYCAARDITERKQNEAELRAAEEQFRGLVEQSISGIYIIQDGRFVYVNPRAAEIFGYAEAEELVGREPADLVAEKDCGLVAENIRRRLAGEVKSIAYTFTGLRKDGMTVEIGAHGSLATYRGRPAIVGVLQDITERKRTEEEARRHLAELQQAMTATVRVASTMGEMRDPYTSGHERRVGELSAAIGAELGLSEHQVEGLRVAGYLHDTGKIVVPAEILAKPGKISPTEFALIKEHARQGYEILKEVNFPWPVALVALQHHERLDGSGYPQGLKGEDIIEEARILAVADTIEAMSSHRPYRPGLGIESALAEIAKHRGTRYDARAVDACVQLFRQRSYRLPS